MFKATINGGILLITFIVSLIFYLKQGKESYTFYGDALGYYSYLPSAFIYHNFKAIEWLPKDKQIEQPILDYVERYKTECKRSPKGYYINQYTYGVALTELPFFFIAHSYEKVKGLPANGYSTNYHYLIKIASLFYAFLGLFFLYKSLRSLFNSTISVFTTSIILVGTNLFWFALFQSGMSHVPLFFLYSSLIYLTIQAHKKPKMLLFIFIGLICGFITITRPSDIVCIFIPLLFNVYNMQSFLTKLQMLNENKSKMLVSICCFFIPIVPQLFFWKKFTGHFLYNSYLDQSFDWLHPQIIKGLFGFANGWLPYTPIMIISLVGILFYKTIKPYIFIIIATLPIYVYIIYSWYCFNYINGFGSRPMIHMYPLLAFPLASINYSCMQKNDKIKAILILSISLLTSINISYSYQVARGDIMSDNSNFQFNMNTLFKQKLTYNDLVVFDIAENQPNNNEIKDLQTMGTLNVNDSTESHFPYNMQDEEYPDINIKVLYSKKAFKNDGYFKCSGIFNATKEIVDLYKNQLFVLEIKRGDSTLLWKAIKINNKIGKAELKPTDDYTIHISNFITNKWSEVYYYVKIPSTLQDGDKITLSIWNISKQELLVRNIKLEHCEIIKAQ